jgi:uncharacterized protein
MPRHLQALALLLVLAAPAPAVAQTATPEFPPLSGRVVDRAGLLSERDEAELSAALAGFEQASGNQLVVATLETLQGLTIEDYGYQLGRAWGIGQAGQDNGALLIVAPEEREVRIEVGYGLEGELTDALSRTIIENQMLPRFRQGDFAAGIKAGVAAMIEALGGTYDPALPPVRVSERERSSPLGALPVVLIIGMLLLNRVLGGGRHGRGRRRRRGAWGPVIVPGGFGGGGQRSGGGFSGGGGSFGGGGASGRW